MSPTHIDFEADEAGIRALFSRTGDVGETFNDIAIKVASVARSLAPVDSGDLRASIRVDAEMTNDELIMLVYADVDYAMYVHQGTGIYGPSGRPIRPKRSRYLVFPSRGGVVGGGRSGNLVFAKEVKGVRPRPFLLDALEQVSPWPVDESVIYT